MNIRPSHIAEIAERVGRAEDAKKWLTEVAKLNLPKGTPSKFPAGKLQSRVVDGRIILGGPQLPST